MHHKHSQNLTNSCKIVKIKIWPILKGQSFCIIEFHACKTVHILIFVQMFRFEPLYAFCISFLNQTFIIFRTVSRNGSESEVELREYDPWAKIPILRQFQFKHKKLLHMKNLSIAWGLDNFSVADSRHEKINFKILCFSHCSQEAKLITI